jgi:hypothetical protein
MSGAVFGFFFLIKKYMERGLIASNLFLLNNFADRSTRVENFRIKTGKTDNERNNLVG